MSDKAIHVSQADFEQIVLNSEIPALVDFWAEWCGPCKAISPYVEELVDTYEGRLKVCKVNVDHAPQIAMSYGVRSIPTLLIFKDGQVVGQAGSVNRAKLKAFVDQAL